MVEDENMDVQSAPPRRDARREVDSNGLEVLTEDECYDYLSRCTLGRIAFSTESHTPIIPINYAVDGRTIVFRSGPGSKLLAAALGEPVTFEVDSADRETHTGWSVVAYGKAWEVHDTASIARFKQLPIRPWAPVPRSNWVQIVIDSVSGRRLPG